MTALGDRAAFRSAVDDAIRRAAAARTVAQGLDQAAAPSAGLAAAVDLAQAIARLTHLRGEAADRLCAARDRGRSRRAYGQAARLVRPAAGVGQ